MINYVKFLLIVLGTVGGSSVFAQQRVVRGTVLSAVDNQPMSGVTISVAGENTATQTAENGSYSIAAGENSTLIFSIIGYESQTERIGGRNVVDVTLAARDTELDEVVVVGYGTQRRSDLTGAVSTIKGSELVKRPVMRASAALQGMAPGVTVTQSSGQPGSDGGSIRIRGIGTLGNSDPLVLIDGVQGTLDGVDPNDIEAISVLKDASAASIYGSRAANGVVLVTTKRGTSDKMRINYNTFGGLQRFTQLPEYVDGNKFMTKTNEANANLGRSPVYSEAFLADYQTGKLTDPDRYPDVDWQKEVYSGSGFLQRHYTSVTGGDRVKFMGSFAYQDQRGLIPNYRSERYSLRLNAQMDIRDNMQVTLLLAGRQSPTHNPNPGGTFDVISNTNRTPPIFPARLTDGRWGVGSNGTNPVARVEDGGLNSTNYQHLRTTFQLNYQPIEGMDLEVSYTPDINKADIRNFMQAIPTYNPGMDIPAYTVPLQSSLLRRNNSTNENTLKMLGKYNRSLQDHTFGLLVGFEQVGYRFDWFQASRQGYVFPEFPELNAGEITNWSNGGTATEWALQSYFSRLNYNYKGRYLLEANIRYDGSSRFAAPNKWGAFPSFSAGWRVSEEAFLKDVAWLSELKLRGSWGKLGNQVIGDSDYPFASLINLNSSYYFGGQPVQGGAQNVMANGLISWESTTSADVGLELGVFNNRLSLAFDLYKRTTNDILLKLPIPDYIGLDEPYQNAATVSNRGWELAVNYSSKPAAKFTYQIGANLSNVKNAVEDLRGTGPYISGLTVVAEGYPINTLFGYRALGLFQSAEEVAQGATQFGIYDQGDIRYADLNEDGVIDSHDREMIGNPVPRYTFGLNLGAQYGGFDLSLLVQGVGKRDVILNNNAVWALYHGGNMQTWQLDHWSPGNRGASNPRLIAASSHNNYQNSTFWVYSGAYVRLKMVQLGYRLPKYAFYERIGLGGVRLFATGDNIWTGHRMAKGWDPERPNGDATIYPIAATYTFGIDISF